MNLKYVTIEEILRLFDPVVYPKIREAVKRNGATHIVVAENLMMDSSSFGKRSALCIGPNCTYKTPADCDGKWLNDLPSQRQYFLSYSEVPAEWRA